MSETQNQTSQKSSSPLREIGAFIWDLIKIIVIALVIIVPFRTFIAEPFVVSGSSMVPNFRDKDYLIVDRLSYRLNSPKRGDAIVLKFPKDTSQYFIKRIIGLPGEKIQIKQNHVIIYNDANPQGKILNEPYIFSGVQTIWGNTNALTLGSGEYFVMGDNRIASSDSREWGILPQDDIVGNVWLRVFPLNDFGQPNRSFTLDQAYLN